MGGEALAEDGRKKDLTSEKLLGIEEAYFDLMKAYSYCLTTLNVKARDCYIKMNIESIYKPSITTITSWNQYPVSSSYLGINFTPLLRALNVVCNFEHYMAFIRAQKRKTKNRKPLLIVLDT